MKKIILTLFFLSLSLCITGCKNSDEDLVDYCYEINQQIKDMDFYTAKINDDTVTLFSSDAKEKGTVKITSADSDIGNKIMYIRKEDNVIYFIESGSVDDESGIMFINDERNNVLDGVKKVERIGGNLYKFSSMN